MADEDQDTSRPSLELPKLFGRKKQQKPPPDPADSADSADSEPTQVIAAPVRPAEAGAPLFADEAEGPAAPVRLRTPKAPKAPKPPKEPRAQKLRESLGGLPRRSAPSIPRVTGYVAAAITGVIVGLVMVGLTAGSLRGCEAVRGTSSCGGAGLWILIAILVAMILLGALLLRLFDMPDPGSSSFLAVGMVAVIALLFLLDVILSGWMVIVIPAITVVMYLLSHWVTTTFVEPAKDS